jgi:hypothetical protein
MGHAIQKSANLRLISVAIMTRTDCLYADEIIDASSPQ